MISYRGKQEEILQRKIAGGDPAGEISVRDPAGEISVGDPAGENISWGSCSGRGEKTATVGTRNEQRQGWGWRNN